MRKSELIMTQVDPKQLTPSEALNELRNLSLSLMDKACSCDLLYGIACGIHVYRGAIESLYLTVDKAIRKEGVNHGPS